MSGPGGAAGGWVWSYGCDPDWQPVGPPSLQREERLMWGTWHKFHRVPFTASSRWWSWHHWLMATNFVCVRLNLAAFPHPIMFPGYDSFRMKRTTHSFNSQGLYLSRCREDFHLTGCLLIQPTLQVHVFYINCRVKILTNVLISGTEPSECGG